MSSAWAGGSDAIMEVVEKMNALFLEEARKKRYQGESLLYCEECGEEIPERRRKAIACRYCLDCQNELDKRQM